MSTLCLLLLSNVYFCNISPVLVRFSEQALPHIRPLLQGLMPQALFLVSISIFLTEKNHFFLQNTPSPHFPTSSIHHVINNKLSKGFRVSPLGPSWSRPTHLQDLPSGRFSTKG
uniref:Uncharacterized protein n=1 Tax=Gopherus agassizii TaxID=38772 RepID=A0A452HVF0_9SAUR